MLLAYRTPHNIKHLVIKNIQLKIQEHKTLRTKAVCITCTKWNYSSLLLFSFSRRKLLYLHLFAFLLQVLKNVPRFCELFFRTVNFEGVQCGWAVQKHAQEGVDLLIMVSHCLAVSKCSLARKRIPLLCPIKKFVSRRNLTRENVASKTKIAN